MGWGDTEEEAAVWLLPPPGTQGAPSSLDGRLITPALSSLGGGHARTWHRLQSVRGTPSTPARGWLGEGL